MNIYSNTEKILDAAEKLNEKLNSFLSIEREHALRRARELENNSDENQSLRGFAVAVKDNICTRQMQTTCGSRILYNFHPQYDATAVKKLTEAGAIIVGKTNMDEFAMGSSNENSAFGVVRNPWDTERVPGGSSGGSAVAVASGVVRAALGSETGGSVRQPASFCGISGLKPTCGIRFVA
jgi:aspartyl-tRNA(Asn)/glutamyl-tRNA(Gln) amidotransferase subunit A